MTYMLMIKVDVNVKLLEGAPSAPTAVASRRMLVDVCGIQMAYILSAVDLDLECLV